MRQRRNSCFAEIHSSLATRKAVSRWKMNLRSKLRISLSFARKHWGICAKRRRRRRPPPRHPPHQSRLPLLHLKAVKSNPPRSLTSARSTRLRRRSVIALAGSVSRSRTAALRLTIGNASKSAEQR